MPKQSNGALASLQLACACLQQAKQQLIACDCLAGQTEPTLMRVIALLQDLRSHPERLQADRKGMAELLLEIRVRSARAQLLLDTAASFHCGAALAGPAVLETYMPDGNWSSNYPNDQICLNA